MSGDTTTQMLKRLSFLSDRDADKNGLLIGGQDYFDVYFTGGSLDSVTITNSTFNGVTNAQPLNGNLTALSGLASAADTVPFFTGPEAAGLVTLIPSTLVGRGSTGNTTAITVGSSLSFDGDNLERAAITGDVAVPLDSNTSTLATVNANVGTFGSATQVGVQTVNAKGLTTAASNVAIAIPSTQVTNFTEAAQDAVGAAFDATLVYNDAGNSMGRAGITGDVVIAAGSNAATIANGVVTTAMLQSNSVTTINITDANVTYAKIQNVSANKLLGNPTGSSAKVSEVDYISGTYTPTLTNLTNITASTPFACQYVRIGSIVTVSGQVNIQATAASVVQLQMSLPVSSNFSAQGQCAGSINIDSPALTTSGVIKGSSTTDDANARFVAANTSNNTYLFTYTYVVI